MNNEQIIINKIFELGLSGFRDYKESCKFSNQKNQDSDIFLLPRIRNRCNISKLLIGIF